MDVCCQTHFLRHKVGVAGNETTYILCLDQIIREGFEVVFFVYCWACTENPFKMVGK